MGFRGIPWRAAVSKGTSTHVRAESAEVRAEPPPGEAASETARTCAVLLQHRPDPSRTRLVQGIARERSRPRPTTNALGLARVALVVLEHPELFRLYLDKHGSSAVVSAPVTVRPRRGWRVSGAGQAGALGRPVSRTPRPGPCGRGRAAPAGGRPWRSRWRSQSGWMGGHRPAALAHRDRPHARSRARAGLDATRPADHGPGGQAGGRAFCVRTCGWRSAWAWKTVTSSVSVRGWSLAGTPARGSSPPRSGGWFWCRGLRHLVVVLQDLARPCLRRGPARRGHPRAAPGRQLHPAGHPGR